MSHLAPHARMSTMKNAVTIHGDSAVVMVIDYKKRIFRPCDVDTADLSIIQAIPGMWYAQKVQGKAHKWYAHAKVWDSAAKTCRSLSMHRIIMGVRDPAVEVDHKDNNGLNNRRSTNLRLCNHKQNHRFRQPDKDWAAYDAARALAEQYRGERRIAREVQQRYGFTRAGLYKIRMDSAIDSDAARDYRAALDAAGLPSLAKIQALAPRIGKFGVVLGG